MKQRNIGRDWAVKWLIAAGLVAAAPWALAAPATGDIFIQCPGFEQRGAKAVLQTQTCAPRPYKVRAGDTWRKLALRHLGSKALFAQIAGLNGRDPQKIADYPKINEVILVPCTAPSKLAQSKATPLISNAGAPTAPAKAAPIWRAKPGQYARDVIANWAKQAGYKVVHEGSTDWQIDVPLRLSGSFQQALDQLVKGFEGSGTPLSISVYSNNVIKVGNP